MKQLRVTAKVYDLETREYVQRITEVAIPDEVAAGLIKAINGQPTSPVRAYGHGDTRDELDLDTVLADQSAFRIDAQLAIIDTDEDRIIGGYANL